MHKSLRLIDTVSKILAIFAAFLTVSIAMVIIMEIMARYIFNYSFSFAWEYSAYAMGIAMFCGASFTFRTGGHIRVSLLSSLLSKKGAFCLDIICTVTGLFFSAFISYALCQLALNSFLSGSTSPSITATPLIIPQGLIATGSVFLTLQLLARLIRLSIGEEPEDKSVSYQVE